MEEQFITLIDFKNYEISNLGRVRSKTTGRIMKQRINPNGYNIVDVRMNYKKDLKLVHRLIAIAFIPNPNNLPIIDHIDGNRVNNNIENLRWASYSQNAMNTKIRVNNTSGTKGISYHKRDKVWAAFISYNNQKLHLGNFKTKEEAIEARTNKANELFKEFTPLHQKI